jgi:hypothetical protein
MSGGLVGIPSGASVVFARVGDGEWWSRSLIERSAAADPGGVHRVSTISTFTAYVAAVIYNLS